MRFPPQSLRRFSVPEPEPVPIIPSIEALVVERDMYKARVEAELQRAAEARRREMAAIDRERVTRTRCEEEIETVRGQATAILADARRLLDAAARKVAAIGRGS